MRFPSEGGSAVTSGTSLELDTAGPGLPLVRWVGMTDPTDPPEPAEPAEPAGPSGAPGMPLLGEHTWGRFTRPHLRGHRITNGYATPDSAAPTGSATDASWSTRFSRDSLRCTGETLEITGSDQEAGLSLLIELERVAGGGLRGRYAVTNRAATPYVVDGLEVVLPAGDDLVEVLDFTGRHERERTPQRHELVDGLWLREGRAGRPGLGSATVTVLGSRGFSTTSGRVLGVHVAWSGNTVLRVERDAATGTTVGGGELLLPGEVVLAPDETYRTPWVFVAAADDGLDGLAACWHDYQRSLASHPPVQPVVLNVWEAVYFDQDRERLGEIAERAARVGVERFVLDDGWFQGRRDDTAGLGDWRVDGEVWPQGLDPLVEQVRRLGMQFGLWFEPEMVNPDSELFRAHPDWVLSAGDRLPALDRHQLVLDLTRPEVTDHLFERVDSLLSRHRIDFVKWDHNRDLLEAGSGVVGGAPAVHRQTEAFDQLLDTLRAAHPRVAWESCASGGGRIDLAVLARVQRVWTSDMTDALARQQIQRWTGQLVAPEYLGAHVSAPTAPGTGRTLPLDFRAATALFGAFGIEWDLSAVTEGELDRLADWVTRHRRLRPLLHTGRVVRPESADPAVLLHGVVARDRSEALLAHVQLDESAHNRGVTVRVPGLDPGRHYTLSWEGPVSPEAVSKSVPLPVHGPTSGAPATGTALARRGFWMPRRRPATATLVRITPAG